MTREIKITDDGEFGIYLSLFRQVSIDGQSFVLTTVHWDGAHISFDFTDSRYLTERQRIEKEALDS